MNFRHFIENVQDETLRLQAKNIVDTIINYIKTDVNNLYGSGLEYNKNYGFNLAQILPGHRLWLKFITQAGWGKNKNSLGEYGNGIISVALPMRTYNVAIQASLKNGIVDYSRRTINPVVAKFMLKPDNYETMLEEVTHYLDAKRTKGKIFKNYPYNATDAEYYNHPSEYNAKLQAFLARVGKPVDINVLKAQPWFNQLNDKLKRHVLRRVYEVT